MVGPARATRHLNQPAPSQPVTLSENGFQWNGKFWPKESNDVIGRRMATVKACEAAMVGDVNYEVEPVWIEDSSQQDIWSKIFLMSLEQLDHQTTPVEEQLATIRQNHELGRLRSFTQDRNLPADVLEKRQRCEERKVLVGGLMEAMVIRAAKIREKRSNFVVNTEDELIGVLIINPLHEKAAGAATGGGDDSRSSSPGLTPLMEDEDGSPMSPGASNVNTTLMRKKREKEKKRTSTVIPSMPNLMNEINFFTDEVVECCQTIQKQTEVNEKSLEASTEALAIILLFARNLISTVEIVAKVSTAAQIEEKRAEINRIGQELGSVIDRLLPLCTKLVKAYWDLKEAERRSTSGEKLERLKKKVEEASRILVSNASLAHRFTEEFTNVALSIES